MSKVTRHTFDCALWSRRPEHLTRQCDCGAVAVSWEESPPAVYMEMVVGKTRWTMEAAKTAMDKENPSMALAGLLSGTLGHIGGLASNVKLVCNKHFAEIYMASLVKMASYHGASIEHLHYFGIEITVLDEREYERSRHDEKAWADMEARGLI